jgi:hypothetical protein
MMDEYRETVGIFMEKGFYRQAESQYLMVPPQRCKQLHLIPARNYVYLVMEFHVHRVILSVVNKYFQRFANHSSQFFFHTTNDNIVLFLGTTI